MFTPVREAGGIKLSGVLEGLYEPELMTTDMAQAVQDAELILVTVPASAHHAVIEAMGPHLRDDQIIVLNPGRTCGALMCRNLLRAAGVTADVTIAETQTIVYTCRKTAPDTAAILTFKNDVQLAALRPSRTGRVLQALPECVRTRFRPADNVLETSLGNVGMILHCSPMLFNAGWIETTKTQFKYYYEGITTSIAAFLELIDQERLAVGERCGITTPSVAEWMRRVYGVRGTNLYECVRDNACYREIDAPPTLQHRYLLEDIPTGLVPLEAIGRALDVWVSGGVQIYPDAVTRDDVPWPEVGRLSGSERAGVRVRPVRFLSIAVEQRLVDGVGGRKFGLSLTARATPFDGKLEVGVRGDFQTYDYELQPLLAGRYGGAALDVTVRPVPWLRAGVRGETIFSPWLKNDFQIAATLDVLLGVRAVRRDAAAAARLETLQPGLLATAAAGRESPFRGLGGGIGLGGER